MDDVEAAEVLALVIASDPYGYGNPEGPALDAIIDAWALSMRDVDPDHAKRAVIAWYQASGKRISISDVIQGAEAIGARDRAMIRAEQLRQRQLADRQALPGPAPTRDRTRHIGELLAAHRNWSLVGDLSMRRKQASWHPDLERAYRDAVQAKIAQERDDEPQAPTA